MKYFLLVFLTVMAFASCDSGKKAVNDPTVNKVEESDTLRIANDDLEYEIIIIEPGFNGWIVMQQPRGYYGQNFLENRNQMFVQEYNRRVRNPQQFSPTLYGQEINYQMNIDYGYEVNYLLYNYFVYFQRTYKQKFPGFRG